MESLRIISNHSFAKTDLLSSRESHESRRERIVTLAFSIRDALSFTMRFPILCFCLILLMATIHAHARLHMRTWSRPFTRMVAINKLKTFVEQGKRIIKFDEILGG